MSELFLNYGYIEIAKRKFHSRKSAVAIDVVYIDEKND